MVRKLMLSLVAAVTILAMMVPGCTPTTYALTMAENPPDGGTATDLTDSSPYAEGTVVNITAVANPCYRFVNWTVEPVGAGTFGSATSPTTTYEMPAQAVTVTANFERITLDHFTVYDVGGAPFVEEVVYLEDQFGAVNATVWNAVAFCNPAQKVHDGVTTPISNPDHHLTVYMIECEEEPGMWQVEVDNQFGPQYLTVWGPVGLAVPSQKEDHEAPVCLDHFLVYLVIDGPSIEKVVEVEDQFGDPVDVTVYQPVYFANPAKKTHGEVVTDILNPDDHVVIYRTNDGPFDEQAQVSNQFGDGQTFDLSGPNYLAVPSEKTNWLAGPEGLDHFTFYWADDVLSEPIMAEVYLDDQFGGGEALVGVAAAFCNPAQKVHDVTTPISNPDHHLTLYDIVYYGDPWSGWVTVYNQFGFQELAVEGPLFLAVPTQKEGHDDSPEGLDHYLVYSVTTGPSIGVTVGLNDQFLDEPQEVVVYEPRLFANPVKKTHGEVFDILNPEAHLVIYEISSVTFLRPELWVNNQFGEQFLNVYNLEGLAVPSWMLPLL